jgi:uncharacterized membrane protein
MSAAVITAISSALVAFSLLVTAMAGAFVMLWREIKANSKATEQVHVMVNQQRTDSMRYQQALRQALTDAGIPVPDDASLPPTE